MIEEVVKIHDKYTLEIKAGFIGKNTRGKNRFNFKAWIYVPSSLDINRHTYSKDVFYRDLKVNTRLITPIYTLTEILESKDSPLSMLESAIDNLLDKSPETQNEYEYQIKMFNSILKSALRQSIRKIAHQAEHEFAESSLESYLKSCELITQRYRLLHTKVASKTSSSLVLELFLFGDEFMSFLIESHCFKLIKHLHTHPNPHARVYEKQLLQLVHAENEYKLAKDFLVVEKDSADHNKRVVFKRGVLKKYMESELFLSTQKKEDAFLVKQFIYSIAAGISMIFATIVAFSFQLKYGNFTVPFFMSLIVGYMLKDRIKELGRFYFAHKMSDRYYDLKTKLTINNKLIGYCKDAFDFVDQENVPVDVRAKRARSSLLELNNKYNKEEVMLYRAMIETDNKVINNNSRYEIEGLNRIIRLNLSSLIRKMDNPLIDLNFINEKFEMDYSSGEKIYYINIILELNDIVGVQYQRYLVGFNRDGIQQLKQLPDGVYHK